MFSSFDINGTLGSITLIGAIVIGTLGAVTVIGTLGGAAFGNYIGTTVVLVC